MYRPLCLSGWLADLVSRVLALGGAVRLNVFRILPDDVPSLKVKLGDVGMTVIANDEQGDWAGEFYFSMKPEPTQIPWIKTFQDYFDDQEAFNYTHFAVFLLESDRACFALTYGKAHFYVRPYCDYDFGIEVAKRIADEDETRQTASKRFAGKRTKDIRSYAANTRLVVESGESVDYINAAVISAKQEQFGKSGKFGTSVQLTAKIKPSEVGTFFTALLDELDHDERFKLPRTTILKEEEEIAKFDDLLLDELQSDLGVTEFAHNSYDLYGVDFIFSSDGSSVLSHGRRKRELESLSMRELKQFIADEGIGRESILDIKVTRKPEDAPQYRLPLKDTLDFIADDDRVVLSQGRWMRFNQDYLDFLDEFIRDIELEETEQDLRVTTLPEPAFNTCDAIKNAGYEVADKDFSIFKTRSSTPVEAWDLRREDSVYAVKFGTAQKLGYACDQALNTLELLRNKAGTREVPAFKRYCLWFGYRAKKLPNHVADTGSIILKQKVEAFARKAYELDITPVVKLTHSLPTSVASKNDPSGSGD